MRLSIVRDGRSESAEVDLAQGTVTVEGRRYPFKVVNDTPSRVELEVGGEKVVIEGWPSGLPVPPGPVDVNGERWHLSEVRAGSAAPTASPTASSRTGPAPPSGVASPPKTVIEDTASGGTAVIPPMPGKIIEVRVHEGDHVTRGQVLVVLEAMKMRNEVPSPVSGRVTLVSVGAGANVRARETMVRIQPD